MKTNNDLLYLLAEISGHLKGLLLHPSDTPLNGCLISEASKDKIREMQKRIESYSLPITKQEPPWETFKSPTCRGSYILGTACGRCEKCEWERSLL
jgi:hypothetical protein